MQTESWLWSRDAAAQPELLYLLQTTLNRSDLSLDIDELFTFAFVLR